MPELITVDLQEETKRIEGEAAQEITTQPKSANSEASMPEGVVPDSYASEIKMPEGVVVDPFESMLSTAEATQPQGVTGDQFSLNTKDPFETMLDEVETATHSRRGGHRGNLSPDVTEGSYTSNEVQGPKTKAQTEFDDMPMYEQVGSNMASILKVNAGKFGAFVNAGLANINEKIGLDSTLYRENQAVWKGVADSNKERLALTYGTGLGSTIATEFGNPLNYTMLSSALTMSGVIGTDIAAENAIGKDAGKGADMKDVGSVAMGMGVGVVAAKLIEPTMKILGKAGSTLLDTWRARGLPDNIKQVLKEGIPEDLEKLLMDMKISDDMGAGFLPMGGKGSDTNNIFEANKGRQVVDNVERQAVAKADDILNKGKATEVSAEVLKTAVESKAKGLKDPMSEAYNNSVHKASTDSEYDMKETSQNIINMLRDEGAPDPVISHVMKQLYSKGRNLTPAEKAATKELAGYKKQLAEYTNTTAKNKKDRPWIKAKIKAAEEKLIKLEEEGKKNLSAYDMGKLTLKDLEDQYILGGSTNQQLGGKITQLKNRLGKLESEMPTQSDLYSEKDLINSVRGITYKTDTKGGDIGANDEKAQYFLKKAKGMLSKDVEGMFKEKGSNVFEEFQRANGLAAKYYDYTKGMKEIQQVLNKGEVLPEEVLHNLMQNPVRLRQIIDSTDKEMGPELAKQLLSHLATPTKQIGVGLEKLDMKATARKLNSVFDDKKNLEFFKKHLPAEDFRKVNSLKDVISDFNKMTDSMPKDQSVKDYLMSGTGIPSTIGKFLGVAYDGIGYMKNSALESVGMQAGKSRVRPNARGAAFAPKDYTQMKQAMGIVERKLKKAGDPNKAGYKVPDLTKSQEKLLQNVIGKIEGMKEGGMRRGALDVWPRDSTMTNKLTKEVNTRLKSLRGDTTELNKLTDNFQGTEEDMSQIHNAIVKLQNSSIGSERLKVDALKATFEKFYKSNEVEVMNNPSYKGK